MTHQVDQLKEEISAKESALVKLNLEQQRIEKEKETLKVEMLPSPSYGAAGLREPGRSQTWTAVSQPAPGRCRRGALLCCLGSLQARLPGEREGRGGDAPPWAHLRGRLADWRSPRLCAPRLTTVPWHSQVQPLGTSPYSQLLSAPLTSGTSSS